MADLPLRAPSVGNCVDHFLPGRCLIASARRRSRTHTNLPLILFRCAGEPNSSRTIDGASCTLDRTQQILGKTDVCLRRIAPRVGGVRNGFPARLLLGVVDAGISSVEVAETMPNHLAVPATIVKGGARTAARRHADGRKPPTVRIRLKMRQTMENRCSGLEE
jgi:hypothetical protein